jgi:hypothetical protein
MAGADPGTVCRSEFERSQVLEKAPPLPIELVESLSLPELLTMMISTGLKLASDAPLAEEAE